MQITCDILIIGAGPAGSMAAKFAAKTGASVILLEKRKEVGCPVQCAEYVPWQITQRINLPNNVIAQRIDFMQIYMPDGEVRETQDKGFMIYRHLFDQHLSKGAVLGGAKLFLQAKALDYKDGVVWIRQQKQEWGIKTKVIIGADGPYSTVGKWIGQKTTRFIYGVQYQMRLSCKMSSTKVYFKKDIPGGYGWVFPKGKIANIGLGVDLKFKVNPIQTLNTFVEYLRKEGIIEGEKIGITGGVIPVGGLLPKIRHQNIILVGDAGGMAHPITGAGILNAVLCGKIAGEAAGLAVLEDNLDRLEEYEEECQTILGEALSRAKQKREILISNWNDTDKLIKAIQKSWIPF